MKRLFLALAAGWVLKFQPFAAAAQSNRAFVRSADLAVTEFQFLNLPSWVGPRMMIIGFESGERLTVLVCHPNFYFSVDKGVSEYVIGNMRVAEFFGKSGKELTPAGPLRVRTAEEQKFYENLIRAEKESANCSFM